MINRRTSGSGSQTGSRVGEDEESRSLIVKAKPKDKSLKPFLQKSARSIVNPSPSPSGEQRGSHTTNCGASAAAEDGTIRRLPRREHFFRSQYKPWLEYSSSLVHIFGSGYERDMTCTHETMCVILFYFIFLYISRLWIALHPHASIWIQSSLVISLFF